jgi:LPXTG-motif cell wall-anchored protein
MSRTTRVMLAVPAGIALLAGGMAAPALAAYPPTNPKCTVTPTSLKQGASVNVVGIRFPANGSVGVKTSGSALVVSAPSKADSQGSIKILGKAGAPGSGTYTLSSGTQSVTCSVTVTGTSGTSVVRNPPAVLPATGAMGVGTALLLGGGLVLAGGSAVLGARRRTA